MIKLNWIFDEQYKTWEVEIPTQDYKGAGYFRISLVPRPSY